MKAALDAVRARVDLRARRDADPIAFVHRQTTRADRELVALLAASCALGNVKAIRMKLEEALERIGPSVGRAADDPEELHARLRGFKHRLFKGEDIARLLVGARRVQRARGTLGKAFERELARVDRERPGDDSEARFREALASFCDRIREEGGLPAPGTRDPSGRRGPAHLLSDARAGSAAKRLLLFLRWMIRPDDGIDLGMWSVSPERLLVPVDVHIHKLARNLGLTKRPDLSWKTCVEITRALRRYDADDPIRYDFSLCHMGMVQKCPSKRDAKRCEGCGVRPVCVHWDRGAPGPRAGAGPRRRLPRQD
ncbi:MAG: TIGR02757 family protein [Deltaproteobacteria bacterium]|nr:TIGR02757 family protein [Deltaproteobacteria bacterium]